jgi:hypothetical protein
MNKTYQCLLMCLAALMLAACQPKQKQKANHQKVTKQSAATNEEDQVVNLVMNLDEVKRKSAQVEKDSQGKRHLVTYVETPPTTKDPNYWVKVSEDNGDNLVAYYTFAVHKDDHQISYYDPMQDSLILLSQWRKTTSTADR